MVQGLIGKKLGMTRIFTPSGEAVPVTVIELGPCTVVQVKTQDRDGYNAVQLGFKPKKLTKLNKPMQGHFTKAGLDHGFYVLKEFKVDDPEAFSPGQVITLADLSIEPGKKIKVTGKSKGRGFTGAIKRWGFRRQPMSHGAKQVHRKPGSSGASAFPGRVIKGKKMPGHYGNETVTIRNLSIVDVKPEKNVILVKGAVPGSVNSYVYVYFNT
ncbi:50S ribosomal protein L3 [Thermodesulfatator indicus DSM 15286]|uniref:Large ribosomal subunit protein uL3 n=1 Tax=Thermodesulfatator indicus (strain DSM 15286 / JCM 11887 / CIR29812) TaxID=667014 RepID=F8AA37_THEID|nr:50S ribosomal protein L3 [Thermodesulfatator indicus]AEH45325.1 50S ribosomal protein L3 [Thermodesulfatator indicus DSM 15286]